MKKIVRNDLWMVIVAWCLVLDGYTILGLITSALASVYLFFSTRYKNYWRILAISLICFSLSFLFAKLTIIHLFSYFTFFCILISINVALLNERLYKERLKPLYKIFTVMFISLIAFMLVAAIMPNRYMFASYKANLYGLIILIFIPYTSEILISLIVKEFNMKRFLDEHKHETPKMYN